MFGILMSLTLASGEQQDTPPRNPKREREEDGLVLELPDAKWRRVQVPDEEELWELPRRLSAELLKMLSDLDLSERMKEAAREWMLREDIGVTKVEDLRDMCGFAEGQDKLSELYEMIPVGKKMMFRRLMESSDVSAEDLIAGWETIWDQEWQTLLEGTTDETPVTEMTGMEFPNKGDEQVEALSSQMGGLRM